MSGIPPNCRGSSPISPLNLVLTHPRKIEEYSLVGGFNHLEKYESQLGRMTSHILIYIMENKSHV